MLRDDLLIFNASQTTERDQKHYDPAHAIKEPAEYGTEKQIPDSTPEGFEKLIEDVFEEWHTTDYFRLTTSR